MQRSFSDLEYAAKKRVTRRDRFLDEIDAVTPWSELIEEIEPFYPKGGGPGAPADGIAEDAADIHRAAVLWVVGGRHGRRHLRQLGDPGICRD